MSPAADTDKIRTTASQVLDLARRLGADAAETSISASTGFSVTARNHDVETIEHTNSRRLNLTVYFNTRKGSASASDFRPDAIEQTVSTAADIAKYTSRDDCAGLAPKELMATDFPDLGIDQPWDLDIPEAADTAIECETAMRDQPDIINTDGATVETMRNTTCYANSHGFTHAYNSTRHGITAIAVAGRGNEMHRDYWYTTHRSPQSLDKPQTVGRIAADCAAKRLGSRKPNTCRTPILCSPQIARSLMSLLLKAINGSVLYRDASFLCGALEQKIFPEFVSVCEYPYLYEELGSAWFDNEGVGLSNREIVKEGVLKSYLLDNYSGCKLNMQTTGNAGGVSNVCVEAPLYELDDMTKAMDTGFAVTELIGQGVNPVTGDYSYGATGFWVENGETQYPIHEATIAGNLRDLFGGIRMLGKDIDKRGQLHVGSMLIDEVTLAGN